MKLERENENISKNLEEALEKVDLVQYKCKILEDQLIDSENRISSLKKKIEDSEQTLDFELNSSNKQKIKDLLAKVEELEKENQYLILHVRA
jgi:septal ring factor EnvC (AmiA/AmiB activator)